MMIRFIIIILFFTPALYAAPDELHILGADISGVFNVNPPGRERQIVEAMVKCMGRKLVVDLAPYGRHISYFSKNNKFDALATVPPNTKVIGFRSISHIKYQNVVTTLKSLKKTITSLTDLKGMSVVSFKGARDILPGLDQAVKDFSSYTEIAQQELHSRMLFLGRVDAVISDRYIFYSHTKNLRNKEPHKKDFFQETKTFPIFDTTNFTMSFRDKKLKDEFDQCVKENKKILADIDEKFSN